MKSSKTEVLISDEYKTRENQLIRFNKWADYEGLDLRMSGEFEHSNKETHMAYLGYVEGQQSKQSEVDELRKRIDRAVEHIEDYYGVVGLSMVVDILKGEETK